MRFTVQTQQYDTSLSRLHSHSNMNQAPSIIYRPLGLGVTSLDCYEDGTRTNIYNIHTDDIDIDNVMCILRLKYFILILFNFIITIKFG